MDVKFSDLSRLYDKYREEYDRAIREVLAFGSYILGPELEKFEHDFAGYIGRKDCVGVGNGLDALRLALLALGVGAGDEVIVQANTFIATALAVSQTGATPVFVDVDDHFGIDPSKIEPAITSRTKAIMVVHLYGQSCDMDPIMEIARAHSLFVVEDCAQCHGATYKGRKCGTFGIASCFSFYPIKPIGAFGDGGAVLTDDDALCEKIKMLRNYGSRRKYDHELLGMNSRLDELQAAILGVSLSHVEANNEERREIAGKYLKEIDNSMIILPKVRKDCRHVFHVFPILCRERDRLQMYLEGRGIHTLIHYPIPCHLAKCYGFLSYKKGDLVKSESYASSELSLPIYVGMTSNETDYIIKALNEFR